MMAYFPNGTSIDQHDEMYCQRCVHGVDDKPCPVLKLHFYWNYCDEPDRQTALNMLWPMQDDGIYPAECAMFHEADLTHAEDDV